MNINVVTDPPNPQTLPLRVLSLCTGIGGDVAAFELADVPHEVVAMAEFDPFASAVLAQKFPHVENIGDITKFSNWSKFNGKIDILIAGIPCQPFSLAGQQKGANDGRELTPEVVRIIREVRPRFVFIENVTQYKTLQDGRAFGELCDGLLGEGYAFDYRVIDAAEVLPQRRKRLFILAYRRDAGTSASQIFADAETCRQRSETISPKRLQAARPASGGAAVHHPPILGTLMASGSGMNRAGMRGHELDFLIVQDFEGVGLVVRRPTPIEALRAQGFPDNWLDGVTYRGKPLTDLKKYQLVGNSWPVPVAASILHGIYNSEYMQHEEARVALYGQ